MPIKNKAKYNAYMKSYMLRRYNERMDYAKKKLGGACSCGQEENLDLDHIDPSTKTLAVAKMWSATWPRFIEEVEKCQLLCKPCHNKKHSGS